MIRKTVLLALLATPTLALAQNLVNNGNFVKFKADENLWDGVDGGNYLAGFRRGTYAVTEGGKLGDLEMPLSVNFIDMNQDGLPDLVTADPAGVVRTYFNSGTKTEPKFVQAEVVPIFPPQVAKDNRWNRGLWTAPHGVPKITMYDWNRRGLVDMVYGNYTGDLVMLANTGKTGAPGFDQPANYQKVRIPTSKGTQWGNLFAPCAVDWNKDGKPDLLVGEGTYSANAVYILLNQSSSSMPNYPEEQRFYLCYGDGREQLVPTAVDFNGDGLMDVLVGDRLGTISVHLNHANWKPGEELPVSQMLRFGGADKIAGGAIAPTAADFNGDGLFDLIIGKANGRIAVCLNTGTKTEPKFDAPKEIQGTNLWADNVRYPDGYSFDAGHGRGNLYAYITVDDEASPGGGKTLKCGYWPSPNKIYPLPELTVDGRDDRDFFHYWREEWEPVNARWAGDGRQTNSFIIRQNLKELKVGSTYELSFKVKGVGVQNGLATVALLGAKENVATKFKKNERGGAKPIKDETSEQVDESVQFQSNKAWTPVTKTFTVRFKEKNLKDVTATTLAILEFKFDLVHNVGNYSFADVQIVEKPAAR